jgi:hypothetical protein
MSKYSHMKARGREWYPGDPNCYPYAIKDEYYMKAFMVGWTKAKKDAENKEDSELAEYEEMRVWFERWEYLKSKYEGETE